MIPKTLTAEQRLEKAVLAIMHRPEYVALAGVMMIGKRVVSDDAKRVPTACTNGRDEWYGRAFVDKLNDAELRFLILHEVYHKLYRHLTTWRWMYNKHAKAANWACDYVINIQLSDAHKDGWAKMPEGGLCDPKYRGWDSAKVFEDLMKNAKEQPQGGGGQGQPGSGDGDGQPQPGGFDEHDWDGAQEMTAEEKEDLVRDIDEALRQGALAAGKMGSGGDRSFEDLLQPKVDWREALREFVQTTCAGSDYSTWQRPNRRYMGAGYYMPSGISEQIGEIVVAPDMSGSIGATEIRAMLGEVKGISDTVHPEAIRLLYWDTEVTQDERYETHELDTMMQTTTPKGGGGTLPDCVPQYMAKNNINAQCAVVLTDGYVGSWGNWPCPVLWVIVDNKHANPPFGKAVHIEARDLS